MEDFFETRISEVDGQMVAFFGVFDGTLLFLSKVTQIRYPKISLLRFSITSKFSVLCL